MNLPGELAQALAEDVEMLAALHDREPTAETLAVLREVGFPQNLGLLPDGEHAREAWRLMSAALEQTDAAELDLLAADYAAIYLTGAHGASPCESVWLDDDHLACQAPMFAVRRPRRRAHRDALLRRAGETDFCLVRTTARPACGKPGRASADARRHRVPPPASVACRGSAARLYAGRGAKLVSSRSRNEERELKTLRYIIFLLGILASAAALAAPTIELSAGMHRIEAEVASNNADRATGLMNRPSMPIHRGMLFVFPEAGVQCFWMKNTLIPLSIAFLDDSGRIVQIADMQPQSLDNHCSVKPVRFALEMNAGWFKSRGLAAGAKINGLDKAPPGR